MHVFNVHVMFDNPSEVKALMTAENEEDMLQVIQTVFKDVKNLEVIKMEDLGDREGFDPTEWQKEQEQMNLPLAIPAKEKMH